MLKCHYYQSCGLLGSDWLVTWMGVTVWCCEGTDWLIWWVLLSDVVKGLTDWLDGCYCVMLWRDWLTDWMGVTVWCSEGTDWLDGCYCLMFWRDWLIGWVLLPDVLKELMDFEMLGNAELTAECHTSPKIWIFGVTAVTVCSVICHCHVKKFPHTVIFTFGVWWLWRKRSRCLERLFVNSKCLPFIRLYCLIVGDKKSGRCIL
jgi:hypothetical protein